MLHVFVFDRIKQENDSLENPLPLTDKQLRAKKLKKRRDRKRRIALTDGAMDGDMRPVSSSNLSEGRKVCRLCS